LASEAPQAAVGDFRHPHGDHACWPLDADIFWEMNNGRILTFYDLGRFALGSASGF
jgi:hypothetical protein